MKVAIKKQRFEGIKANKQANNDEVFSYINPMTNMMRKLLFGLNPPKGMFRNYSNAEFSN